MYSHLLYLGGELPSSSAAHCTFLDPRISTEGPRRGPRFRIDVLDAMRPLAARGV